MSFISIISNNIVQSQKYSDNWSIRLHKSDLTEIKIVMC